MSDAHSHTPEPGDVDPADAWQPRDLLLIVVGAELAAEIAHRPLAYRLRERILRWQDRHLEDDDTRLVPVVCTDIWHLNQQNLADRPTLSIGSPEINATSAFFASRVPPAFTVDGVLAVHADIEFIDQRACAWSMYDHGTGSTASAIDAFVERYLDGYLRSAHNLPAEA